jgi:large subunit ribosomal protein L24
MLKFKVGDTVKITSGKDKGREGKIERIFPKTGRALIPGMNLYKKHVKNQPGRKGGIFEIPRSLPFSKLSVMCPKCKKAIRVGFKIVGKEKVRVCKKCRREIDTGSKGK